MDDLKESFNPLVGSEVRILILGSIPGDRSIKLNEYYGHPQNRFWRMIADVCGCDMPGNYLEKKAMIAKNRIALWDVAHKAIRKGSLDSAIRDEEPNDVAGFMGLHPELRMVAFNGKKAEQLYDRYFERLAHIQYLSMPSTSPANAACRFEELYDKWNSAIRQGI